MRLNQTLLRAAACLALGAGFAAKSQEVKTWTGGNGNFFDAGHWDTGTIPGTDPSDIAVIDNGSTATILATDGTHTFGTIRLGPTEGSTESGHVIMNGGRLNIGGTSGDSKAVIGFSATLSSFIMNGGTIFFDGPDTGELNAGFKGVNELDWEVGERGVGLFEMHNDAVFNGSDDLKVAENAAGNGTVLIDGNARLNVGSGISISAGGTHEQLMTIGGNARVDSGNSMGAGNPLGGTDEGYLTMATASGVARLVIQENGILNIRRLTAREGTSTIIVKDHGQFHIFDVLNGTGASAADRPAETGPNSTYPSTPATAVLTLQDDAVMTVNSEPASGPVQGLGISSPRDPANAGGTGSLVVKDRASFSVAQNLYLGTGANPATSDGTLEVVGPAAKVMIGGNLNMAVDTDGNIAGLDTDGVTPKAGKATLSAVITASTHASVNVTGLARITHGRLKISTVGFTPSLDATYTLIKGPAEKLTPTIEGTFKAVDTSGAQLPAGLGWSIIYSPDKVEVKVVNAPGRPDDNGLTPKTATFYINTAVPKDNNGGTESTGVAVAANNNVIIGWEDDNGGLQDYEAVWTMFDSNGSSITPEVTITSIDPAFLGQTIDSKFMSYFRLDGSPIPGRTAWGPKIKPNLFGDGVGMGASAFDLGLEVTQMLAIGTDEGGGEEDNDFPAVQLLNNSGQPLSPLSIVSFSDADAEPLGAIRIGDWDYLSTGNILIVGENRQAGEVERLGAVGTRNPTYKVVSPSGQEIKALTLVSSNPTAGNAEMWHGAGVTQNGFAIRWAQDSKGWVRLFDNAGNPTTENIDISELAEHPGAGAGGRGDSVGFHGNGKDAYVIAAAGADKDGANGVIVTVINADGTLRYSVNATAGLAVTTADNRVDAAIAQDGRVLVVFSDTSASPTTESAVQGRLLSATGSPLGGIFVISEKENPLGEGVFESRRPRASWRGNMVAIIWESKNAGVLLEDPPVEQFAVAGRFFTVPAVVGEAIEITTFAKTAGGLTLTWTGGTGPFIVQKKANIEDPLWTDVKTTSERQAEIPIDAANGFLRIQGK